ncbi:MAG: cytochrome c1 [Gallionella sp.]|nr:cytochrome c1 [Gallionella sp.]MDD4945537.1 cytochrome c1 [Gallionella sp.]MDD5611859.1 cytochrome c1 [Gallionella sp.]
MNKLLNLALLWCLANSATASEIELEKIHKEIDSVALERGVEALMADCHSCHSLKYVKYRDLIQMGLDKRKVDALRGEQLMDAPMMAEMPESDAIQSFGKAPPDLSLMVKAREGGDRYVYSYLLGYYTKPDGMLGNHIYPETRMPDPLGIAGATGTEQRVAIQGRARDIVSFLDWAADPHEVERLHLGNYVLAYLFVLTTLLYLVKQQIWSGLRRE